MLKLSVKSYREGSHESELSCEASEILSAFPEFVGEVHVHVVITRVGRRYQLRCKASCETLLTCDYSLQEYNETINAEFQLEYVFDTELYLEQKNSADQDEFSVRALHEDESQIDIGNDVRQELAVRLPLKRIAPELRDKSIEDLVDRQFLDDGRAQEGRAEETWGALKNLRFDNN